MKTNRKVVADPIFTHEGARAVRVSDEQELRRSIAACMLWEDSFYESGKSIAERIQSLIPNCRPEFVAACAYEARTKMKLRHVPLLLVREMARLPEHQKLVDRLLPDVIQRADEITEFLSIYWKTNNGKKTLSSQIKRGLAEAFSRFGEYDFAKYNRDAQVKLRDALFLCHAKPAGTSFKWTKLERKAGMKRKPLLATEKLYSAIVNDELKTPDTWEVALSSGVDKKEAFERLMKEKKLGALAFIRNLRNMVEANVDRNMVESYAETLNVDRVLPFRFVAAARACPTYEPMLDKLLLRSTAQAPKLPGKTVVIVDVSGSMYGYGNISKRSDMSRVDAAGALAAIMREVCESPRIYATAGNDGSRIHATAEVPARRGMALVELFTKQKFAPTLGGGGIFLKQCLDYVKTKEHDADRIIVFTDEQDCDTKCNPASADAFGKKNYLVNISVEKNGIAYQPKWTKIDGWSEHVIDFIRESEADLTQ